MEIFLTIIIILLVVVLYLYERNQDNPKNNIEKQNQCISSLPYTTHSNITNNYRYKKYYRPKRYLITINELKFYNVLLEIAKELDLILFSQVSLYNILDTKQNLDYKTKTIYFNKIASKSIDFVLVDKKDCRIKLCIELDDCTHNRRKRIERDMFINELFNELEINLLRYPTYNVYYKETLKKRIQEKMKEHYYIE